MKLKGWVAAARGFLDRIGRKPELGQAAIGLALGGGFARAIAHVGVLRVFERERIPIRCIAGVSAGAIVAAAYASGKSPDEIEQTAERMKFKDVARWSLSRLGLASSERMAEFLKKLLNATCFEEMRIPLAVVATDLTAAQPVVFRDRGDVILPIRASCSYPGLFQPIRYENRFLVDGAITMEIPSLPLREMGATRIVSVSVPMQTPLVDPQHLFRVVNQCFQILQSRTEWEWRRHADLVLTPAVGDLTWDAFDSTRAMVEAGERAATAALPKVRRWLAAAEPAAA
jgi:NTE family protein